MDNYIGEIRPFSFNFAPRGWHLCDGRTLNIAENTALFSLLGTTFGGDGRKTFGLPDLRGRCVVSWGQMPGGSTYIQGEMGGVETVTLVSKNVAPHTHLIQAENTSGKEQLPGNLMATPDVPSIEGAEIDIYANPGSQQVSLNPQTISTVGGGQAHNNMQPFQVINYCIATTGIYPPRP